MFHGQRMLASIVVPTYKENLNLRPLITRVFAALAATPLAGKVELLVVDDNSNDGSQQEVEALAREGHPCRIIVRTTERGLSSAVIRGFDEAVGREALLCMDADLQHPPEKVPEILAAVMDGKHEFAIGTRYATAELSVDKDWPLHRRVMSSGARMLARPLSPLSDPMTGFFAISKTAWLRGRRQVSPVGFKICMESYIKCGIQGDKLIEVPILFGTRAAGESKLTGKVIISYLQHLVELYYFKFGQLAILLVALFLAFLYIFLFRK